MSAAYTQEHRRIAIDTPLGKDVLLLESFTGNESISRLFRYDLELMSEKDGLSAKELVGKKVTFSVEFSDGAPRYFNGYVNRFSYIGRGDRLSLYRAEVVPWPWFLTRKSDCRIFQNKSVPDIIKQIFGDLGFTDFTTSEIKGSHPEWEYCVQYRETNFNFVSRLMEHEGIFYYFKHEKGKHTLVLADQKGAYKDCQENEVDFLGPLAAPDIFNHIVSWEHGHEFRSGKWAETDYNFETPSNNLMVQTNSQVQFEGSSKLELYDYPGEYEKKSDGDADVRLRIEEEEVGHENVRGESYCRSFSPGFKFKLRMHHSKSEEGKGYVITSVSHSATGGGSYVSGSGGGNSYSNQFSCIPDSDNYRPPRITPKPAIHGVQTAVVVGPKGEEIYPDKYGRVKVQFHWDREGKFDEKSSCWIRVANGSAGKHWGSMFIPRIGQEVVITYLEGDPDRPLITGVVYNAEQMPHYTLPDEKSKSYIKSNSSKNGDGFNEIRFEDKADNEQVFMHAQRNMDVRVLKDSMELTKGNRHQIIGTERDGDAGDQLELVWRDKCLNVRRNSNEQVEGNFYHTVGYGGASDGGNAHLVVEKDRMENVGKDHHVTIGGNQNIQLTGKRSLDVGGDMHEKVAMNQALEAGQNIHIKAGMSMVLEAGLQLTFKVGGNFVDISPAGVAIQGVMVLINSGGAPGVGAGSQPAAPTKPEQASMTEPTEADNSKTGQKSSK